MTERLTDARRAGFHSLMLLLERLQRERAPVGTGAAPGEEGVRFRHDPSLAFSPSDVAEIERHLLPSDPEDAASPSREIYEITTTFLGLTGTVSPLPSYFSEELLQDEAESRQRDFLDIFHHRVISLLYRAKAKYDLGGGRLSDGSDAWSRRLLALVGYDGAIPGGAGGGFPSWRILRLSPLLSDGKLTGAGLEKALADVLGSDLGSAGVFVEQFVGSWVDVEPSQVTRLGRNASRLGSELLLGRRIFDRSSKFRIVIGPLSRDGYARFAEGGEPLRRVAQGVSTLIGDALEYEIVLWLSREAAPSLELSSSGRTRLGKNSWLGGQSREARIRVQVPTV